MADTINQLQKLLYEFQLANGLNLVNVDNLEKAIDIGFNSNPDVYSIVNYLSKLYIGIPKKPYRKSNGKYEEITDPSIVDLVNNPNKTEVIEQFEQMRYIFYLVTGNSFVYAPRLQNGNNLGQLTDIGRIVMPSQYVEIISGGWRDPVKGYIINYNYTAENIPVNDVIHVKMPNLNYVNGQNFYGLSPIRVAAMIIQAQNGGYETMGSTLKRGFPSGVLSKKNEADSEDMAANRVNMFKKIWKRFYGKSSNSGEPIITAGDVQWTPMGFSNFRDLQIIENTQHGLRVLCNIYGIPSQVMNDIAGTTFNNQKEVRKAVYNNRIVPDCNLMDKVDNIKIWSKYGFEVWSDYSAVPELQADKKEQMDVINAAQNAGALYTAAEIRAKIDDDVPNDPIMNERFMNMGRIPVSQVGIDQAQIDQALKRLGIENYIK